MILLVTCRILLVTCWILMVTYSWILGWSQPGWLLPLSLPESWQLGLPQAP